MRNLTSFLKSTLVGGLFVLLPIAVLCGITAWLVEVVRKAIAPVVQLLPDTSIGGVSVMFGLVLVGLVALCFLAGLLAETTIIRRASDFVDRIAQSIPGYTLMKNVGANLVGIEDKNATKTVLVRFEATSQLGFLMETLGDGRHVVFVPGVPGSLVGTLHIVANDRIEFLSMTVSAALDALSRLGVGLNASICK